jgi:hypothetical protein
MQARSATAGEAKSRAGREAQASLRRRLVAPSAERLCHTLNLWTLEVSNQRPRRKSTTQEIAGDVPGRHGSALSGSDFAPGTPAGPFVLAVSAAVRRTHALARGATPALRSALLARTRAPTRPGRANHPRPPRRLGGLNGAFFEKGWGDLGCVDLRRDLEVIAAWPPPEPLRVEWRLLERGSWRGVAYRHYEGTFRCARQFRALHARCEP